MTSQEDRVDTSAAQDITVGASATIITNEQASAGSRTDADSTSEATLTSSEKIAPETVPAPSGEVATETQAASTVPAHTADRSAEATLEQPVCNNQDQAEGLSIGRQQEHPHHNRKPSGPSRAQQHRDLWADPRLEEFRTAFANRDTIMVTAIEPAHKLKDGKPVAIAGHRVETHNGLIAFLPISEMQKGVRQKRLKGHTFAVKIIALEYSEREGVTFKVSREKALKDVRKSIVDGLKPGYKADGHVVDEHDHGYFVNIGGDEVFPGMVRCWLSKARVPKDQAGQPVKFAIGSPVAARISTIENGQVKLTMTTKQERTTAQDGDSNGEQRNDGGQRRDRQHAGNRSHGNHQRHQRPVQSVETAAVVEHVVESAAPVVTAEPATKPTGKKAERRGSTPKPVNQATNGGIKSDNLADFGRMWKALQAGQQSGEGVPTVQTATSESEVTPAAVTDSASEPQ